MDITVRRATLQDREDVLSLVDNYFAGLDYLPAVYNTWYHDKRYIMSVAESDGKVVGFKTLYITSKFSHVVMSTRISPDYQKTGVHNQLKIHTRGEILELYPMMKYQLQCITSMAMFWKVYEKYGHEKYDQGQRNYMFICFQNLHRINLKQIGELRPETTVTKLTVRELADASVLEQLRAIVDREGNGFFLPAFGACPLPSTNEDLKDQFLRSTVFVTRKSASGLPSSLSLMRILQSNSTNVRVEIMLYCQTEDDLISHLIKHVQKLESVTKDVTSNVLIYWPSDKLDDNSVWNKIENIVGQKHMNYADMDDRKCVILKLLYDYEKVQFRTASTF